MSFLKAFLKDIAGLSTTDLGLMALGLAGLAAAIMVMFDPQIDPFMGMR